MFGMFMSFQWCCSSWCSAGSPAGYKKDTDDIVVELPPPVPPPVAAAPADAAEEQLTVTSQSLLDLEFTTDYDTLKNQKQDALSQIINRFIDEFPNGSTISWRKGSLDSSKDKKNPSQISFSNFTFNKKFWEPAPSREKKTVVMNGDTSLNEGGKFRHEFLGGPLGNGTGQQEALCFMFPELLALKNLGVDLGKTGIIKGLTAFGNVEAVSGKTRSLTIGCLFKSNEIFENKGTFDLLQVVADPLAYKDTDTINSFTNLYNSYKASFDLAQTDSIILPGLAGSGIFKNNPHLCAAAAILAAHDAGKQLEIYGLDAEQMTGIIKIVNGLKLSEDRKTVLENIFNNLKT